MIPVLLSAILVGAFGMVAAVRAQNALIPGAFFAFLWSGYTAVTVFVFAPSAEPYVPAMVWILVATFAVVFGSTAVGGELPVQFASSSSRFPGLRLITLALVLACLFELAIIMARSGYTLRSMVSYAVITQVSSLNRYAFGYGDQQQGTVERILFIAVYAAPLFGGALLAARRSLLDIGFAVAAFLLGGLIPTLYGSRMGVLWGGSFALSAYLATIIHLRRPSGREAQRLLVRMTGIAVIVLLGLSLVAMLIRYAVRDSDRPLYLLVADPFGFFAAFSLWFPEGGLRFSNLLVGYRNFESLLQLVGIRVSDAASISIDWPPRDVGFTSSNIYTVFRFLIEDFGTLGALISLGGFGAVSARSFRATAAGSKIAVPALTLSYAFVLTSFSMSLTYYTTVVAAACCFCAYFGVLELAARHARPAQ
jgi:hypothetical protein